MRKKILFLDMLTPKRIRTIQIAKQMGLQVVLAAPSLHREIRPYVDHFIKTDLQKKNELIKQLQREHAKRPFDGVISFWDRYVEMMAVVSAELGLSGNTLETAQCTRNKIKMREHLKKSGVPHPRFRKIKTLKALQTAAEYIGYPFIFKPVGACSSKGIFKIDDKDDLKTAFDKMKKTADPNCDKMFSYYAGEFMAEEFMDGKEFSVEGVADAGNFFFAGITKKWVETNYFHEVQHVFPAEIPEEDATTILNVTKKALESIGFRQGGFHVEVMLTEEGPKIVEINGRLGGDFITTHLVPLGHGVEIIEQALKVAIKEKVSLNPIYKKSACVHFLLPKYEGLLAAWHGLEEVKKMRGIKHLFLERHIGERVSFPPSKYGEFRLAAVISVENSEAESIQTAQQAATMLQPTIRL